MTFQVDMGLDAGGASVPIDLEELLATRLLVQGNSGSGKSHLLRRLLERSAGQVQQIIIDPEGDFVTLGEKYGHIAIAAADYSVAEVARFGQRIREHRTSVVLDLEGLEMEGQMRCAAAFLGALFDAPREHWYPALVVVDEAQVFAPSMGAEVTEEVRRASLGAMTNLMCRGRKRGLAGIIATQRLAKLAKNVAAEASNFLMGRTFLDIDMARAADLLGMERRQAEQIRDLPRGTFLALGPAVCRRPIAIKVGSVETGSRGGGPVLTPLPQPQASDMRQFLFAEMEEPVRPPPPPPRAAPAEYVLDQIETVPTSEPARDVPKRDPEELARVVTDVLRAIVEDRDSSTRPAAVLYQDFQVRCRMVGVHPAPLSSSGFSRRLAAARAGIFDGLDGDWAEAIAIAHDLPDEMLGCFLLIARAAREGLPAPTDEEIAHTYGTSSLGRARRVIGYIEGRNLLVTRVDLSGKRSLTIPALGWTTAAADAV
ncbi:ATP-binding protein [Sphingomonas glacialis]|uniref:ATP-binding protein n=1 Tax=Sphingomonas glacialis TaxID=658225 RepID=A0A502FV50_9SPHN|nr:ATP-binding protein [Sphingomonas glacialis]TPG52976.1 ATP-binding protein [Sphingomonas glacialis]